MTTSGVASTQTLPAAQRGDAEAFGRLMKPEIPRLRRMLRRFTMDPDDVDDILQATLLKAHSAIDRYRGDSSLSTWLHTIAVRQALDHLRAKRRYRAGALIHAQDQCIANGDADVVRAELSTPDFVFDVYEHISYCFSCVSRTLDPDLQAPLILRDVLEQTNDEGARTLGVTKSVFRHRLAQARTTMTDRFESLCALVNKNGVCYQCEGLRNSVPDETKRGRSSVGILDGDGTRSKYEDRLRIVRDADPDAGRTQRFHDLLARQLDKVEQTRTDDSDEIRAAVTDCGA